MVRAVIVGLGKQSEKHAQGIISSGGKLLLGCDLSDVARREFSGKYGCEVFESLPDEMSGIDLGVICTPVAARLEIVEHLLNRGVKTLVIEKPLCITVAQAEAYSELEKKYSARILVNYTYRLSLPYYHIKKLNLVDRLAIDYGMFYVGGRGSHRHWKHLKEFDGGVLNEMAIHMLDLADYLFGKPESSRSLNSELVRPTRKIGGKAVKVDADDLVVLQNRYQGRTSIIISDFLSPMFSNRVQLTSEDSQLDCSIGSVVAGFESEFSDVDEFNQDSYARMYTLIAGGDIDFFHRPSDTCEMLHR